MRYSWVFLLVMKVIVAGESAWDFPEKDLKQVERVALYRGSFDPFHEGHASVVEGCLREGFSHVFLFPAFRKGEKKRSSLRGRTELLKKYANGKTIQVLEFEEGLELQEVRDRVVGWIIALQKKGVKVFKVLGGDAAYQEIEILPKKPPNVVDGYILASRAGFPITNEIISRFEELGCKAVFIETEYQDLSSTKIRNELAKD